MYKFLYISTIIIIIIIILLNILLNLRGWQFFFIEMKCFLIRKKFFLLLLSSAVTKISLCVG